MNFRRFAVSVVLIIVSAAAAAWIYRGPLSLAFAKRVVADRLSADLLATLPDGLHVGLCGAGSPFPDDRRSGPCTAVVAGKRLFVFDAGSGSARNLGKLGFVHGRIEAIFLTHFHSDHIDGLGELMLQRWVSTANVAPVAVYGPPGVEQVVAGLSQAYAQDRHYRVAHHGEPTVPASGFGGRALPFALGADGRTVVLQDGDLEIVAFVVDHAPIHPAVGYRIRYKDRSMVLSGDTKQSANVLREARGTDLLVHEALSETLMRVLEDGAGAAGRPALKQVFNDVQNYHTTPEQAAETARDAGVRYLLLNHIAPGLPLLGMDQAFLGGAPRIFKGPVRVGQDGDFVSLPTGATRVDFSRRF